MSRSLFARLAYRFDPAVRERAHELSRREVLRSIAAAAAAGMLSGTFLPSVARGFEPDRPRTNARKVAIIGGGLAGLACAYELRTAGYSVRVLEARGRLGGRVLSFNDLSEGGAVEGGAEFIGANHPRWLAYAERFKLDLVHVGNTDELLHPVLIDGRILSFDEVEHLYGEMAAALQSLNVPAAKVNPAEPWTGEGASELDARSLGDWLEDLDIKPLTAAAIRAQIEGDNGVPLRRASYLGMLACIAGGGVARYWTESETHRCKGGNSRLVGALAAAIGAESIRTGTSVRKVELTDGGATLTLRDGSSLPADEVVLAVPPSVWDQIEFAPGLPDALAPQMGANSKFMARTRTRFWLDDRRSPAAMADGPLCMTWEATDGHEGDSAVLTGFAGADHARTLSLLTPAQREDRCLTQMNTLYPGLRDRLIGTRFMDWLADPLTRGSYTFPAPGEVTTVGPTLARAFGPGEAPRLHFAGEHTAYAFVGYMEAALSSGAAVASRIAARDGLVPVPVR